MQDLNEQIKQRRDKVAELQKSLELYKDMKLLGFGERAELKELEDRLEFRLKKLECDGFDAKIEILTKVLEIMKRKK